MSMSWLYTFKPQKDRALYSASHILLATGVTPNMVTAAGLLLSVIGGLLAASGHLYAGIFFFIIGACLDAVDGSFARACGLCTGFGRYFDSICDRLSELVLIAGAVIGGVSSSAFAVIAGSLLLLASRIYNHRKGLNSNAAMFGRPEGWHKRRPAIPFTIQYDTIPGGRFTVSDLVRTNPGVLAGEE